MGTPSLSPQESVHNLLIFPFHVRLQRIKKKSTGPPPETPGNLPLSAEKRGLFCKGHARLVGGHNVSTFCISPSVFFSLVVVMMNVRSSLVISPSSAPSTYTQISPSRHFLQEEQVSVRLERGARERAKASPSPRERDLAFLQNLNILSLSPPSGLRRSIKGQRTKSRTCGGEPHSKRERAL